MPSGAKKRRAAKRKKELEANQNHATNQQEKNQGILVQSIDELTSYPKSDVVSSFKETVGFSTEVVALSDHNILAEEHAMGEGVPFLQGPPPNPSSKTYADNTSGIENVTDEGLAKPVEGLSEVIVCSDNLVADAEITLGAEDIQGEAVHSIDALTSIDGSPSNPQSDVSSLKKTVVQFSSKKVAPILAEEHALGEGEVQSKENALSEEVDHVDESTLESSTESLEAASCEVVGCKSDGVAQDALKECEASSMAPYADELDRNPFSFDTVLSKNEQVLPQLGEDSRVMPMGIVTLEKKLNLSSGGGSSERENILDNYKHQSPESSSGLKQIYFACPLHCDSSCRLNRGVVSSCEEQDARDDGKKLGAVEQLERLKNNIEAELHVAEQVSVLCRKLLDDLNAI